MCASILALVTITPASVTCRDPLRAVEIKEVNTQRTLIFSDKKVAVGIRSTFRDESGRPCAFSEALGCHESFNLRSSVSIGVINFC